MFKRLLLIVCAAVLSLSAAAQVIREIRDVDIRVELEKDGSAWVTQVWDAEAGSSGTEFYIPIGNLGPMTVSQLSVSENGQAFESLGNKWDERFDGHEHRLLHDGRGFACGGRF